MATYAPDNESLACNEMLNHSVNGRVARETPHRTSGVRWEIVGAHMVTKRD
jgi:hypothetical protein